MAQGQPKVFADVPGVSVLGVVQGQVARNGSPKYDVQVSNGNTYSTFDTPRATRAQAMIGQVGTLRIEIRGDFQNYEDFIPSGGIVGAPVGAPGMFAPTAQPAAVFPQAPPQQQQGRGGSSPEFRRGAAVGAAANLLSAFVGTGFYLDTLDAILDTDRLIADLTKLAGGIARYAIFGPEGEAPAAAPVASPMPKHTPEQIAAWAAAAGADVMVGVPAAPVAEEPSDY